MLGLADTREDETDETTGASWFEVFETKSSWIHVWWLKENTDCSERRQRKTVTAKDKKKDQIFCDAMKKSNALKKRYKQTECCISYYVNRIDTMGINT